MTRNRIDPSYVSPGMHTCLDRPSPDGPLLALLERSAVATLPPPTAAPEPVVSPSADLGARLRELARAVLGEGDDPAALDAVAAAWEARVRSLGPDRRAQGVVRAYRSVFVAGVERLGRRLRADPAAAARVGGTGGGAGSSGAEGWGATATLPLAERLAVLLVDRHGLGVDAASRVLGVAERTVDARLDRGRLLLRHPGRAAASDRGVEDPVAIER